MPHYMEKLRPIIMDEGIPKLEQEAVTRITGQFGLFCQRSIKTTGGNMWNQRILMKCMILRMISETGIS